MRVLHVYRTYFPDTYGGLERAIQQITAACKSRGVENTIYTVSRNPVPAILERPEAMVIRVPLTTEVASCSISLSGISAFKKAVTNADLVHYYYPWPWADVLHELANVRIPCVMTYVSDIVRQEWLGKLYSPLMNRFVGYMRALVASSPNYVESSPVLQRFRDKVSVIPLGLDEGLYPKPDPERIRRWQGQVGSDFFLFVGVLRYYKGLHVLLDAAKDANFRVVIVGEGPEGDALKRKARNLGLRNVTFLGFVDDDDKTTLMSLARGFVFPSHLRSEAYGLSLLEAAMHGKPMVSCEIGTGTSFINVHGETGFIVQPGCAEELRSRISEIQGNDELASKFGSEAYSRYQKLFTSEHMGKAYCSLFQDSLDGSTRI